MPEPMPVPPVTLRLPAAVAARIRATAAPTSARRVAVQVRARTTAHDLC